MQEKYFVRTPKNPKTALPSALRSNIRQECIPVGCVSPVLYRTRGPCPRESLARGISVEVNLYPVAVSVRETPSPLWTEWLTVRCKNIMFPHLRLRAVKILSVYKKKHQQYGWTFMGENVYISAEKWFMENSHNIEKSCFKSRYLSIIYTEHSNKYPLYS